VTDDRQRLRDIGAASDASELIVGRGRAAFEHLDASGT